MLICLGLKKWCNNMLQSIAFYIGVTVYVYSSITGNILMAEQSFKTSVILGLLALLIKK